jgi:hypothetical protein
VGKFCGAGSDVSNPHGPAEAIAEKNSRALYLEGQRSLSGSCR